MSVGKAEMVSRGKQTVLGAAIGLIIVFTSYMIIQLVFSAFGLDWRGKSTFPQPSSSSNASDSLPAYVDPDTTD